MSSLSYIPVFSVKYFFQPINIDYAYFGLWEITPQFDNYRY